MNVTDRMGIHLLLLILREGKRQREEGRGKGEDSTKRADCTINHDAPSCLHRISHITDSFPGRKKLNALNRATITHNETVGP